MLTKSQAKAFFLGGTALCGAAFLLLTVDTLKRLPKRSNQENMTAQVVRGHDIWRENNCMGCHTLLGEGAYYAPELTKVVERRGEAWISAFLEDPESFYPGQRKMVKYDFFDPAIVGAEEAQGHKDDVIAFLAWVGRMDTNGFPAEPDLVIGTAAAVPAAGDGPSALERAPQYFKDICSACHQVGGEGGIVGPSLDGVSQRFDEDYLRAWLLDPQSVKPGTTMPQLPGLEGERLDSLIAYLQTL